MIEYRPKAGEGLARAFKTAHGLSHSKGQTVRIAADTAIWQLYPSFLLDIAPTTSRENLVRHIILARAIFLVGHPDRLLPPAEGQSCPSHSISDADCRDIWDSLDKEGDTSLPLLGAALRLIDVNRQP